MFTIRHLSAQIFGLTAITAVAFTPLAQAQIFEAEVKPSTVEMIVKPGDLQRQTVTLTNPHQTKTIRFDISLSDWTLDDNGALILGPFENKKRSAMEWISVSQYSVTLEPETSQDIKVQITPPYDIQTKGDHRFALLATTLLPELDEHGVETTVWNRYQLTSLFYLTVSPSKSLPEVARVVLDPADPSLITLEIKNEGDAHARLQGAVHIKDANGDVASETPLNVVVLDNGRRNYDIQLKDTEDLASGEYVISFDLKNTFAPQSKKQEIMVPIESSQYIVE